jgi:hypothetical protein
MTIIAEPTFIASLNGLRGFIIVIDVGEVDAFTPSGNFIGVFHDRIAAAEAVLSSDWTLQPIKKQLPEGGLIEEPLGASHR